MTSNDNSRDTSTGDCGRFISHPNTRTLHNGTREEGADCGSYADSWATIDAMNPLQAVVEYAVIPCTHCIDHTGQLNAVYQAEHTATVIHQDVDEIVARLPWELIEETE